MTIDEIKKEWDERSDYIRNIKNVNADEIYKFFMDKLDKETERLKAELNELKEKHKKDVMKAYIDADPHFLIEEDAEEYYKQKFESND